MTDHEQMIELLRSGDTRREERRRFMRGAAGATLAAGGLSLLAACSDDDNGSTPAPTPTPTPSPTGSTGLTDVDVFNFALNLEYLEAQFYVNAVYGQGLPAAALTGTGTQGAVTGGRKITFTDPVVAQYAREIATNESLHVNFIRSTLGASAIAQPALNIDGGPNGAFTAMARSAGLVGPNDTFDPYASDENFLLAAYLFEDVGVTAYKGSSTLITNKTFLEAAAGILATEAYHAGLLRTALYTKGLQTPSLRTSADKISDARDSLDGNSDDDQGISGDATTSNIVPSDANGIAFSRTTGQVLNIDYLTKTAAMAGGFFPAGVNGNIRTSAASG